LVVLEQAANKLTLQAAIPAVTIILKAFMFSVPPKSAFSLFDLWLQGLCHSDQSPKN
jgi:hypothetical protein